MSNKKINEKLQALKLKLEKCKGEKVEYEHDDILNLLSAYLDAHFDVTVNIGNKTFVYKTIAEMEGENFVIKQTVERQKGGLRRKPYCKTLAVKNDGSMHFMSYFGKNRQYLVEKEVLKNNRVVTLLGNVKNKREF